MKKRKNLLKTITIMVLSATMFLTACGAKQEIPSEEEKQNSIDTGFKLTGPDSYDSADTPVLVDMDDEEQTITFLNLELGKKYTLSMDGTTKLYDKYGESISLNQIQRGDIVDITFLKEKKHLTSMKLSSAAWKYDSVERYELNQVRGEVTIGSEIYKLNENAQYFSAGRVIEDADINPADVLTFKGIDKEILSVNVEKGHGYLRLANDEQFIGGWIEIGQSLIQQIKEDMVLTVPEGSYQVNISHNGNSGIKNVVINRNEETVVDIGDIEIAEPEMGDVLFSVTPSGAKVYIDGTEVDTSLPVTLQYGIHQLIARAEGYQTVTCYLRVGTKSAGFDVVLDKIEDEDDEEDKSSDSKSSETSSEAGTVTDYYKVYIDAPEAVEVYLDGNYVGISPCSFRKSAGTHVITLRKTGCESRSYTVQIDDEKKDFSYSFADLVVISGSTPTTSTTPESSTQESKPNTSDVIVQSTTESKKENKYE